MPIQKNYPIKSLEGLPIGEVSEGNKVDIIDIPYSKKSSYYHVVTYMFEDGKFWRYVNGKSFETDQKVKIFADNFNSLWKLQPGQWLKKKSSQRSYPSPRFQYLLLQQENQNILFFQLNSWRYLVYQ